MKITIKKLAAYTKAVLAIVFASAIAVILNTLKSKFGIIQMQL